MGQLWHCLHRGYSLRSIRWFLPPFVQSTSRTRTEEARRCPPDQRKLKGATINQATAFSHQAEGIGCFASGSRAKPAWAEPVAFSTIAFGAPHHPLGAPDRLLAPGRWICGGQCAGADGRQHVFEVRSARTAAQPMPFHCAHTIATCSPSTLPDLPALRLYTLLLCKAGCACPCVPVRAVL